MKLLSIICFGLFLLPQERDAPVATTPSVDYVGSTTADDEIKLILRIPAHQAVEFARWHLTLDHDKNQEGEFTLDVTYGESQPNTRGFKPGSGIKKISGTFAKVWDERWQASVLSLSSSNLSSALQLLEINANVLHILDRGNKMLVGNGGWSCTLSRREQLTQATVAFKSHNIRPEVKSFFEGRTPCHELAQPYGLTVSDQCIKMKWAITFYRDSSTLEPHHYTIRKVVDNEVLTSTERGRS